MPLYSNILPSRKPDDKGQPPKQSSSNPGLKLLQNHLLAKKRAQQHQQQPKPVKPIDNSHNNKANEIISERTIHASEFDWNIEDEYDPRLPNSYEVLLREYISSEEKKLAQGDRSTKNILAPKPVATTKKIDLDLLNVIDKLDDGDCSDFEDKKKGAAIAPPPNLSKTDESTPVLLLQNMVGPGEVDDSLEAETKEECKKYGEVVRCLIYEIPNKSVPDDEAVRIFVEFAKAESAMRALNDLDGRYFGGRIVRAIFYDIEKFHRYELGQPVNK